MKKIARLLAVLCLTVTGACNQQSSSSNLLIGKWKLVSGATGCDATMNFTEKQGTFVDSQGQSRSMALRYVAANQDKFPATVYVITDAGMTYHTTWIFSAKDTVQLDAYTMCTYQRV
jgi:hypothetical protein